MLRFHLITAACLLVVLIYLLNSATDEPVGELNTSEMALTQDYDYFLGGVDSTRFDTSGQPEYRLRSPRLTHYPEQGLAEVEAPRLTLHRHRQPPWRISAEQGRVTERASPQRGDQVELIDNVHARRARGDSGELNVYTDFLRIYPDSQQAETDREVEFQTRDSILRGVGMRADLNRNLIELLANVRGTYAPQASP